WNETSLSGNRCSRADPGGMPRWSAISRASAGCALPENSFSLPCDIFLFVICRKSSGSGCGWGGRIRTFEYGIQTPAPYRLATPQHRLDAGLGAAIDLTEERPRPVANPKVYHSPM